MVKGEMRLIPAPLPPEPFEPVPAHNYTAMGPGTPPVMSVGDLEHPFEHQLSEWVNAMFSFLNSGGDALLPHVQSSNKPYHWSCLPLSFAILYV